MRREMGRILQQQVDEFNIARKHVQLQPIKIRCRKCLRCNKKFNSYDRRLCDHCHLWIEREGMR